jgi:hypothetical protein
MAQGVGHDARRALAERLDIAGQFGGGGEDGAFLRMGIALTRALAAGRPVLVAGDAPDLASGTRGCETICRGSSWMSIRSLVSRTSTRRPIQPGGTE